MGSKRKVLLRVWCCIHFGEQFGSLYWARRCMCLSQFSSSVVSNSLQPHGLQHTRLPCPSPTPEVYSSSRPLHRWYNPTISFSVVPFSTCLQSFPGSGSFLMSWSSHQVAKVLEFQLQHQDWFPLQWTGWISLQSKGLSRVLSKNTLQKHQFFGAQLSL